MADVAVVIPCYNGASYIEQTLESVLAQRDVPREVFVIDDGSTDDSAARVERLASRSAGRITLIRQANAGESRARNVGIARAAAKYVAFLDADDLWLPDKTSAQVELLESQPQAASAHSRLFNFERDLDDCQRSETERSKDDPSVEDLIDYHWVCPSTLMVRRSVLIEHRITFNEATRYSEDMLFAADIRLHGGAMRMIDQLLVAKRVHRSQQSRHLWHSIRSAESRLNWVRDRRAALGDARADAMRLGLEAKVVKYVEDRYWRRDLAELPAMQAKLAELCPQTYGRSTLATRRIWPRWVYSIADSLRRR
jgi:glycosyltransferase involved in cell wall biosynthesis